MNNTQEENYFFKIKTLSEKREDFRYTRHPLIQKKHSRDKINKEDSNEDKELNNFYNTNNFQKISLTEKKKRTISVYTKNEKKRKCLFHNKDYNIKFYRCTTKRIFFFSSLNSKKSYSQKNTGLSENK